MTEQPPPIPEASVVMRGKLPFCGSCNRQLQSDDQWRCPYQSCRRWLRGAGG